MDLYVRPTPTAEAIYFQNARTEKGRLFKDFTASPGTGFETVALNGMFDIGQIQIAVNYFGGATSANGVVGEIRISIGDDVWAAPFSIPATRGNRGVGADQALVDLTVPNGAWVLIDPLAVIAAN